MRVFHGSTLVASQSETTHWHDNGRNRPAISSRQLGSGMRSQQGCRSLSPNESVSEQPVKCRVFVTAFNLLDDNI